MRYADKRKVNDLDVEAGQAGNRQWWTDQTMSYDWKDKVEAERFTDRWYDEIDKRFVFGARLFAHDRKPFDRIIPFERLAGRDVLEIGCGMGMHSELLVRAGARLTAIDISDTSVEATTKRLALRGLEGKVVRMDARHMDFPDASFDFVWSWGVIHHSAQTGSVIREIHRVLRDGGETRIMVYNLDGMPAYITMARRYLLGFWRGGSLDEYLWKDGDGFLARYYSKDMLTDVMRIFFEDVRVESFGQDVDGLPLPRRIRRPLLRLMSEKTLARRANARGSLLFTVGKK